MLGWFSKSWLAFTKAFYPWQISTGAIFQMRHNLFVGRFNFILTAVNSSLLVFNLSFGFSQRQISNL
jgi:hypothetical protein